MARGSFQRRGNAWTAIVDLPPDPATGKRRQKRVTARTKRDVELQIATLIQAGQTGFIAAGKTTIREFLDRWLETTAPTISAVTYRRYRDLIRLHISSVIGNTLLGKLSAADVQGLYANRLATLSPASVRYVHCVLHHALDDAVKWGLLNRNVCDAVEAPRKVRSEMHVWNAEQVGQVLDAAEGDPFEAFWRLAIFTGMRRGELLALKWSDLDLDGRTLAVQRALRRGMTARLEEGEPKSRAGRRRIALSASIVDSLKRLRVHQLEHRLATGEAYEDHDYVFATETGRHLHPNVL